MSDYIRREDVVAKAKEYGFTCALSGILTSILNEIPAADVRENVRGEWVKKDMWYCCLNCGHEMFFTGTKDSDQRYCSWCGAEMR